MRDGLAVIDELYDEMESSGRGAFLIVHGRPGSGKTTFLSTVYLFRRGVTTVAIEPRESIPKALETLGPVSETRGGSRGDSPRLRIVTIKDRESLSRTPVEELSEALQAINQFLRTPAGLRTLIAWPCNTGELVDKLVTQAREIGGTALLSSRDGPFLFQGPPRAQFLSIARRTIATFNAGASLVDLGITEEQAARLAEEADTIGAFLLRLNQEARRNQGILASRLPPPGALSHLHRRGGGQAQGHWVERRDPTARLAFHGSRDTFAPCRTPRRSPSPGPMIRRFTPSRRR
ncbi:MAG: hypothetical protein U0359_25375 [Byssovorax sp.]